jgi:hypothetical protein
MQKIANRRSRNGTPAPTQTPSQDQSGSQLPLRRTKKKPITVEDLKDLSEKELVNLANGYHRQFCGSLRKAMVDHARLAGAALVQLKTRHKRGSWEDWLRNNFKGSLETARLYMRVARNWHLIEEHGLDRGGITLEEFRWILSESPGSRPGSEPENKESKPDTEGGEAEGNSGQGDAAASNIEQIPLRFSADEAEDFKEQVRRLGVEFDTDNTTDTVREAVRRCYEEVTRG